MSKKQLLTESEIRRFMKLANLEPLAKNVVREGYAQQDEGMPVSATDEQKMMEAGLSGDDSPPEAVEKQPMDAPEEGGEDTGDALKKLSPETKEKVMQLIAADLGVDASELDLELGGEGEEDEEDMDMEMSDEGDDEGEEEEDEEKEEMDETLSEDSLVETVLARVTARLVAEAAKKGGETSAAKKMAALRAKKKGAKKPASSEKESKKESLELKGDKLEEATSAEGGGPLLKQGKNKYDVYKGHADMTMAKGDKGGKGGHSLETLSAKAEHTVTHGGKNLATLGGNKKKV